MKRVARLAILLAPLAGWLYAIWHNRRRRHEASSSAHVSETAADYERAGHRILILGAGFGGLTVARALVRALPPTLRTSTLVVDRNNSLLFTPLLWTVADGRAAQTSVVVPIRAF